MAEVVTVAAAAMVAAVMVVGISAAMRTSAVAGATPAADR